MDLEQWFSTGDHVVLQGTFGRGWRYFCLSQLGGVSSGGRPGMLLNILQGAGQPSTTSGPKCHSC